MTPSYEDQFDYYDDDSSRDGGNRPQRTSAGRKVPTKRSRFSKQRPTRGMTGVHRRRVKKIQW